MRPFNLDRWVILALAALAALALTLIVRGGGYGIGGVEWDTDLEVSRASLRLGSFTVKEGDRIVSVNTRPVHRDADLRGVLRDAEGDGIWLEMERPTYEVATPLSPRDVYNGDLPMALRGPYELVAIDDTRIHGDMTLPEMARYMEERGGEPSVFTLKVPDYTYSDTATRVRRPSPIPPMVIVVLTFAMVLLALMRARNEVMSRPRRGWYFLGLSLACGGVVLAFLTWHDGFLADPALLPFGLGAITLWRPLALFAHELQRTEAQVPPGRFFRLAVALPAAVLFLAALYGWARALPGLSGTPLDGFVFDQLRLLVFIVVVVSCIFHVGDLLIFIAHLVRGAGPGAKTSPAWIGNLISSLFLLAAIYPLTSDPDSLLNGGYVLYFGGLVALQMLGDIALLPRRTASDMIPIQSGPGPDLPELLAKAQKELQADHLSIACRLPSTSVVLTVREPTEGDSLAESPSNRLASLDTPVDISDEMPDGTQRLQPGPLDERLDGLLELLDAEGGMFPRYKTYRGSDELENDPFEGLGKAVGVQFVIPIAPPPDMAGMQVHLVARPSNVDYPTGGLPPSAVIEFWQDAFSTSTPLWQTLVAEAATGALELALERAAAHPPADDDATPTFVEKASNSGPSDAATELSEQSPSRVEPQLAPDATPEPAKTLASTMVAAERYYLAIQAEAAYPFDDPDLVLSADLDRLKTFIQSRGPMAIVGELGSGREFTARLIHRQGLADTPFLVMDCTTVPEAVVLDELRGAEGLPGYLEAAASGALCIRSLSVLSEATQKEVLECVLSSDARLIMLERLERLDTERDSSAQEPDSAASAPAPPGLADDEPANDAPANDAPARDVADSGDPALPGHSDGQEKTLVPHRADDPQRLSPSLLLSGPVEAVVDEAVLVLEPLRKQPKRCYAAADFYLHHFAMALGRVITDFEPEALAWLTTQPWPANFLSLQATVRDAVLRCSGDRLELRHLHPEPVQDYALADVLSSESGPDDLAQHLQDVERKAVMSALERSSGNKSQAARLLGMKRTTFIRKLAKYETQS